MYEMLSEMSAGEFILNLLISICLTAFLYLLVPVILIIRGKQYPASKIKKIATINGAVVWLVFTIIQIEQGADAGGAAGLLWAWVGYKLLLKKLAPDAPVTNKPAKNKELRVYRAITAISIIVIVVCALIILINW